MSEYRQDYNERLNAEYDRRESLGVLNMRERAASIRRNLNLQSEPGAGATITLTASLPPARGGTLTFACDRRN